MKKRFPILFFLFIFGATSFVYLKESTNQENIKMEVVEYIEDTSPLLIKVSDVLWECAEIALQEYKSAKFLEETLEKEGFRLDREVAGLPTAFVASYGSGKPIIGILAEYDALPGLSQEATSHQKVRIEGGAGHGCGHNLFGAGSVGAAISLKIVMEKNRIPGTVRLYGCPAEEDVGGKLYMARDGLFDDLDACIAWHPDYKTEVDVDGSQAIDDLEIEFTGKTSHAAFDPWKGASALDALEMTTFGINLLREHIRPSVRIHYVITDGGEIPNIVPEKAKLWVWVRDSTREGVKIVVQRIEDIARGAAIATATVTKVNHKGSYHEMFVNMTGSRAMQKNLEWIGPIKYTGEDQIFAKKIQGETEVDEKGAICTISALKEPAKDPEGGSTDVAEVSWIVPTIHLSTTCAPHGIPWHSWAVVTSSKHPIGYKGMILAAKVMATTALDLLFDKDLLIEMRKEFDEKRNGYIYKSGIPADRKNPIKKN